MKARPEDDPNATQGEGAASSVPSRLIDLPFTLGMGAFFVQCSHWCSESGSRSGLDLRALSRYAEGRRGGHV